MAVKKKVAKHSKNAHIKTTAYKSKTGKKQKPKLMLRYWAPPKDLPTPEEIHNELLEYTDVLMGRKEPPVENNILALMEYSNAVLSRALELTMRIQEAERNGEIKKGDVYYKTRTGELRTFIDLAKASQELGSRRVTLEKMQWDQMMYGVF